MKRAYDNFRWNLDEFVVEESLLVNGAPFCALAGCNLKEKYARNNAAAHQWLQANIGG
jgi:hypothetical protein